MYTYIYIFVLAVIIISIWSLFLLTFNMVYNTE